MEESGLLRDLDDRSLLLRIASGHQLAAYEFVRRHEDTVLREAYRVVRNRADAEDVRAELLMRLLDLEFLSRQQSRWPPKHASGWLVTVTRHLALDVSRSRDAELERRVYQRGWGGRPATPYDVARAAEISRRIEDAMRALPPEEAEAVQLLDLKDLPVREACQRIQVSKETLYRRRARALARLREHEELACLLGHV